MLFDDTDHPRQVLRRGQRRRRDRRRGGAPDRRAGHQLHQLAGVVPPAGADRGGDHRLGRSIADPPLPAQRPAFDWLGAVLSALGLFFVVFGVLQSGAYGWGTATQDYAIGDTVIIHQGGISPVWLYVAIGVVILALFFGYAWARERNGRAPLVSVRLFRNLTSNLGLLTQNLPMAGPAGRVLRDLGVPPAGPRLLRDRDRAGAAAGHDRPAAVVRGRATHGPPAQPTPADPVRLLRHRARPRPAAALGGTNSPASGATSPACSSWASASGSCSPRRSTSCSRPGRRASRATSPASRAASPTWARRWVWPSPAPSSPAPPRSAGRSRLALVVLGVFAIVGWVAALLIRDAVPPGSVPGDAPPVGQLTRAARGRPLPAG